MLEPVITSVREPPLVTLVSCLPSVRTAYQQSSGLSCVTVDWLGQSFGVTKWNATPRTGKVWAKVGEWSSAQGCCGLIDFSTKVRKHPLSPVAFELPQLYLSLYGTLLNVTTGN